MESFKSTIELYDGHCAQDTTLSSAVLCFALKCCPPWSVSLVRCYASAHHDRTLTDGGPHAIWSQGRHTPHDSQVSPEPVAHVSQNKVAALLLRHAQQTSDRVFMGHTVSRCCLTGTASMPADRFPAGPNDRGILSGGSSNSSSSRPGSNGTAEAEGSPTSVEVIGPDGSMQHVSCNYLVLADGANSTLRSRYFRPPPTTPPPPIFCDAMCATNMLWSLLFTVILALLACCIVVGAVV